MERYMTDGKKEFHSWGAHAPSTVENMTAGVWVVLWQDAINSVLRTCLHKRPTPLGFPKGRKEVYYMQFHYERRNQSHQVYPYIHMDFFKYLGAEINVSASATGMLWPDDATCMFLCRLVPSHLQQPTVSGVKPPPALTTWVWNWGSLQPCTPLGYWLNSDRTCIKMQANKPCTHKVMW